MSARIRDPKQGRNVDLGTYDSAEAAARAFDEAACNYHGDKAVLNFPVGFVCGRGWFVGEVLEMRNCRPKDCARLAMSGTVKPGAGRADSRE